MNIIKNTFISFATRGFSKTVKAMYYHMKSDFYKKIGKKHFLKKIYNFKMYLDILMKFQEHIYRGI